MKSMIVYAIKCEDDKYFVGKTTNLESMWQRHKEGYGSVWTKLHKPLKIMETIEDADKFDEDKMVKKYMNDYGIDNVRGGSYIEDTITEDEYILLQKEIDTANDRCYYCGEEGHFQGECPDNIRELELIEKHKLIKDAEVKIFNDFMKIIFGICFVLYTFKFIYY